MSKVILYVAVSQDNFIADSDGGVDWLPQTPDPDDVVGFKVLMNRIGTIVMGSKSYLQILGFGPWAWSDKQTYVFTSQKLTSPMACITFTNDSPQAFMNMIQQTGDARDIWLLGGAALAKSFAQANLIDEIVLTIIPVNLGRGILLDVSLENFTLVAQKLCMDGIVQKTYEKIV